MTSRDRVLAAIERQTVDHIPLVLEGVCHGSVRCINAEYPDPFDRSRYYLSLGVDHAVQIGVPGPPQAEVDIRQWEDAGTRNLERGTRGVEAVLVKEYVTPKGTLRQEVRKTRDYPHAEIPLFSDHNVPPGRTKTYLVADEADLPALACILRAPSGETLAGFRERAKATRRFCDEVGILMAGNLSGIGDPMMLMSGVEPVLVASLEDAGFVQAYVDVVAGWNQAVLEILIDAGVDVVVRRGWYESTDFWSPELYRRFLAEPLRRQVETAHQAGVKFTYVMNSGAMPLLSTFKEIGFDVLSNIDPVAAGTDAGRIKREIGDEICLCGGINNTHVLEEGTEADVERAVNEAIETLGPETGFILAPGDSPGYVDGTDQAAVVRRNIEAMIGGWKRQWD